MIATIVVCGLITKAQWHIIMSSASYTWNVAILGSNPGKGDNVILLRERSRIDLAFPPHYTKIKSGKFIYMLSHFFNNLVVRVCFFLLSSPTKQGSCDVIMLAVTIWGQESK